MHPPEICMKLLWRHSVPFLWHPWTAFVDLAMFVVTILAVLTVAAGSDFLAPKPKAACLLRISLQEIFMNRYYRRLPIDIDSKDMKRCFLEYRVKKLPMTWMFASHRCVISYDFMWFLILGGWLLCWEAPSSVVANGSSTMPNTSLPSQACNFGVELNTQSEIKSLEV